MIFSCRISCVKGTRKFYFWHQLFLGTITLQNEDFNLQRKCLKSWWHYSFDDPKLYDKFLIKPSKQVNVKLIVKEWDNILRIMATLGLKKSSQSVIVKKLSSYQSNDTLRALIELDKIIMSLYMLDYIDDEGMRKTVHRSLNRGESYHQLRSAIAKRSSRKLAGKTEIELTINNECARLLANCMIFYNASLLSGLYEHYKLNKMKDEWLKVIRLSPVAWQHINLIGIYEFYNKKECLNLHQACRYLVINFGTSQSPKFTRQRDKYACGALAVLVLLNYDPPYGAHNLRSPMTDAFSYVLYFACGKTSDPKATRDYRPRSATFLGLQRML